MSSTIRRRSYFLPETLVFLEVFAFVFRKGGLDKEEARHTNCGVDPERFGSPQVMVKEGESISKDEACDPEACDCNRHCRAANTIRENFLNDDPVHGSKRHGITHDNRDHERQ